MPSNCQLIATINHATTVQYSDGSVVGGALVWSDITSTQADSPKYLSVAPVVGANQYFTFTFNEATALNGIYFESIDTVGLTATLSKAGGSQVGSATQIGDVLMVRSHGIASNTFTLEISGAASDYTLSKPVLLGYDIAHEARLDYEWRDQYTPWSGVEFFETETSKYAHSKHLKAVRSIQFNMIQHRDYHLLIKFLQDFDLRPLLFVGYDENEDEQYIFGVAEKNSNGRSSQHDGRISIKINAMHKRVVAQTEAPWR